MPTMKKNGSGPMVDPPDPAVAEFTARQAKERAKCLQKYGPDALVPTGHPELDVMDYMINELVGLVRYSQMLEARCVLMDKTIGGRRRQRECYRTGVALAHQVEGTASRAAYDLIALRQDLKRLGLHLGLTEGA